MKAPVDELLATEIAGHVAVVVTEVVAAADGLARLGFARQSGRGECAIAWRGPGQCVIETRWMRCAIARCLPRRDETEERTGRRKRRSQLE